MESTNDTRHPRGASKRGHGKTPPDHHWVKALVHSSLYHRLRAYAGLSEMTVPAFVLATLANAVPLAPTTNPRGSSPRSGDEKKTVPAPAHPAPEGGAPHA